MGGRRGGRKGHNVVSVRDLKDRKKVIKMKIKRHEEKESTATILLGVCVCARARMCVCSGLDLNTRQNII